MLSVFEYWFIRYRRTWRGSIVISFGNPLLFLLGVGAGLGHLVDRHAPTQLSGVSYAAFFAPGLLAAAAMQTAFLEASGPVARSAAPDGSYRDAAPTPLDPEQGVDLCRDLALGTAAPAATAAHAAYLCALTVLGFVLARATYRRRLHA